jgi:hypothetical protein
MNKEALPMANEAVSRSSQPLWWRSFGRPNEHAEKAVEQLSQRRLKEYEAVEATRQDEQWRQRPSCAMLGANRPRRPTTRDKVRAREKELRAEGKPERAITKTITLELGLDRKTVEKYRTKPK